MSEEIKKVTKEKNPNRVAAGKKSYETHMIKLKEDILTGSTSNTTSNTYLVIPLVILVMLLVILPPNNTSNPYQYF